MQFSGMLLSVFRAQPWILDCYWYNTFKIIFVKNGNNSGSCFKSCTTHSILKQSTMYLHSNISFCSIVNVNNRYLSGVTSQTHARIVSTGTSADFENLPKPLCANLCLQYPLTFTLHFSARSVNHSPAIMRYLTFPQCYCLHRFQSFPQHSYWKRRPVKVDTKLRMVAVDMC